MAKFQQMYAGAERQQLMADQLAQGAMRSRAPQQTGRIAPSMGLGEGLAQLGEALFARRAGKKAEGMLAQADAEKAKAQAAALQQMAGGQMEGTGAAPVNPYAAGQGALEAGIDPNIVASYMKQQEPAAGFGVNNIDPEAYEPSSVQKFLQTNNFQDLVPRTNMYGKYNPGDYTPESWAQFEQTKDPSVLQRFAANRIVNTSGGGVMAVNPLDPTNPQTVVSDAAGTNAAANKAGAETQARAQAEAEGKALGTYMQKAVNAQGVLEILDMAEPIIDVATGSATGEARDKVAAWFGVSTEGAQGIAQLAPLQAALMLAAPRMEGPQSDADVKLYRDAAGQIGNPSVPAATKKAALQLIRRLNQKYQGYQPGITPIAPGPATPPPMQTMPTVAGQSVSWTDL